MLLPDRNCCTYSKKYTPLYETPANKLFSHRNLSPVCIAKLMLNSAIFKIRHNQCWIQQFSTQGKFACHTHQITYSAKNLHHRNPSTVWLISKSMLISAISQITTNTNQATCSPFWSDEKLLKSHELFDYYLIRQE